MSRGISSVLQVLTCFCFCSVVLFVGLGVEPCAAQPPAVMAQQAYLKASSTASTSGFGSSVAISGNRVVIGAPGEDSCAMGVNRDPSNNTCFNSGAAYVFDCDMTTCTQLAYLKASNRGDNNGFGISVAISGSRIVVGAYTEDSCATGVDGSQTNSACPGSGASYVFDCNSTTCGQIAYLKPSNTGVNDQFGFPVAISGNRVLIGAIGEDSCATGVNGNQTNDVCTDSGAAYVFDCSLTTCVQLAYLKASNTGVFDFFGSAVAIDGSRLVVGADYEASCSSGVDGSQTGNSCSQAGAAYVFDCDSTNCVQRAYLKADNTGTGDRFGTSVALSGNRVVVGALHEDSCASGVNGNQTNNACTNAGAAYVFDCGSTTCVQLAYLKASNTRSGAIFGTAVAISGNRVLIGAQSESSCTTGVDGNQGNTSCSSAGAAYIFDCSTTNCVQLAYLKASNTRAGDQFGTAVAVSGIRSVIGAHLEDSCAMGVGGNEGSNSCPQAGAAYAFLDATSVTASSLASTTIAASTTMTSTTGVTTGNSAVTSTTTTTTTTTTGEIASTNTTASSLTSTTEPAAGSSVSAASRGAVFSLCAVLLSCVLVSFTF